MNTKKLKQLSLEEIKERIEKISKQIDRKQNEYSKSNEEEKRKKIYSRIQELLKEQKILNNYQKNWDKIQKIKEYEEKGNEKKKEKQNKKIEQRKDIKARQRKIKGRISYRNRKIKSLQLEMESLDEQIRTLEEIKNGIINAVPGTIKKINDMKANLESKRQKYIDDINKKEEEIRLYGNVLNKQKEIEMIEEGRNQKEIDATNKTIETADLAWGALLGDRKLFKAPEKLNNISPIKETKKEDEAKLKEEQEKSIKEKQEADAKRKRDLEMERKRQEAKNRILNQTEYNRRGEYIEPGIRGAIRRALDRIRRRKQEENHIQIDRHDYDEYQDSEVEELEFRNGEFVLKKEPNKKKGLIQWIRNKFNKKQQMQKHYGERYENYEEDYQEYEEDESLIDDESIRKEESLIDGESKIEEESENSFLEGIKVGNDTQIIPFKSNTEYKPMEEERGE